MPKTASKVLRRRNPAGKLAPEWAQANGMEMKQGTIHFPFQHGDVAVLKVLMGPAFKLQTFSFSINHVENTTQWIPSLESCTSSKTPETPAQPCGSESLGICQSLRPQSHVCNLLLSFPQCCQTSLRSCFLPRLCQRSYEDIRNWLQAFISELSVLPQADTRE